MNSEDNLTMRDDNQSKDNVAFNWSKSNKCAGRVTKPYLENDMIMITDNNSNRDYGRNQIEFSTVSASGNGKYCDYKNGYITIPLVCRLISDINFAAGTLGKQLDMKGSDLKL